MLDVHTLSFLFSLLSAFNRLNKCDVCLSSTQRLQTSTKMPHLIRYWHWTACVLGAVPLPPDGVLLLDSGVDKKGMRQGHWLGLVLCVPVSGLTLMIGQQEVQKPCFTNPRGSVPKRGGGRPQREPADPGSPGTMAVKWQ